MPKRRCSAVPPGVETEVRVTNCLRLSIFVTGIIGKLRWLKGVYDSNCIQWSSSSHAKTMTPVQSSLSLFR